MILVVKRQKEQNLLDSFSVEYNAGTFSPYTVSSGNSGKDYDVDFDTIYKSSSVVKTSTSYPVELGVSVPSNGYDVDFEKSGQSGTYRTAQANNTFTGESDSIQSYSNYSLSDIEKVADDFSNKCDSGDEILFVLKV